MSKNLFNRILTSTILLIILIICLFTSKFLWLYLLIITSIISFYEFNKIIRKIYKNKNNQINLFRILSLIFLILFGYSGYYFYESFSLILILSVCILSDTGGYIIGKSIGQKKLTKISPNKTIAGSIGSFMFSIFPAIILWLFFKDVELNFISKNLNNNLLLLIIVFLFLSFICQLGDLFISYFKRLARVKDTGSILPGHGGLLDRIDGLIFVIPILYLTL